MRHHRAILRRPIIPAIPPVDPDAPIVSLFSGSDDGLYLPVRPGTNLYQEIDGSRVTPAVAANDPVGEIVSRFNPATRYARAASNAARGTLQQDGDGYYVALDGIDDEYIIPQLMLGAEHALAVGARIPNPHVAYSGFGDFSGSFFGGAVGLRLKGTTTQDAFRSTGDMDSNDWLQSEGDAYLYIDGVNTSVYTAGMKSKVIARRGSGYAWGFMDRLTIIYPGRFYQGGIYSFFTIDRWLSSAERSLLNNAL